MFQVTDNTCSFPSCIERSSLPVCPSQTRTLPIGLPVATSSGPPGIAPMSMHVVCSAPCPSSLVMPAVSSCDGPPTAASGSGPAPPRPTERA